jgi:hypothetical protein
VKELTDNPYQSPAPSENIKAIPAFVLALLTSSLGTAVLIIAAMHVRSDRSQSRQPIITYVGPLSSWMPEVVYVGLGLSLLGFLASALLMNRHREKAEFSAESLSAAVAIAVAVANAMGSFIAYCAIWED